MKESFKMDANNKSQNASNPGGPAVLNGNFPHYRNFNAQAQHQPFTAVEFNKLFPEGFHIYHMDSRHDFKSGFNRLRFFTVLRQGWRIDIKELNEYQIKEQEPKALSVYLMRRFKKYFFEKIEKDFDFHGKFSLDDVT